MTILTEQNNQNTENIDMMSAIDIVRVINEEDKKIALAVETQLVEIAQAVDCIAKAFIHGGRLAYFGAGTSGRLGVLDASECWPTFGVKEGMVRGYIAGGDKALRLSVENAEDNNELALEDIKDFNPSKNDVVVGISASGNPPYVLTVLENAKNAGAKIIGISSNPEAKMKNFSDIFICPVVGQEAITGSSRMKSGTAQKMILNMLSTGAMIRIGKTYKNYMIDVRIVNEKLLERGRRFVSEICNINNSEATKFLKLADNNVKTACVMALLGCNKTEAEQKLAACGGILRKVI